MIERFINDDAKLRNGGRKARIMDISELKIELWKFIYNATREDSDSDDDDYYSRILTIEDEGLLKDLKFANYPENIFCTLEELNHWISSGDVENVPLPVGDSLLGFHTLPNDFTFFGVAGVADGSDFPMFSIFYYDGNKVRAYTPIRGNYVCTDNKCAFFMEEYSDIFNEKATKKRCAKFGIDYEEMNEMNYVTIYELDKLPMNFDAMKEDIEARIVIS